jgi:phosphatidylserine decarboxylase
MQPITYIDRSDGKKKVESVYGESAIAFLYGPSFLGSILRTLSATLPFISAFYGWMQKQGWTKRKILPFIERFHLDTGEFLDSVDSFRCFNDFFIRKLKPSARPLTPSPFAIPADGRYYFYPDLTSCDGYIVKGKKFSLEQLLNDKMLAERYRNGSMVLARLCPTDYHRFHFPCDGIPAAPRRINGALYSVNPFAIRQNIDIFTENKRVITEIATESFGKVLYIEVGATNVGSIIHTSRSDIQYHKGDEKGYFAFGASALILLFEQGHITFDKDLVEATRQGSEIRCLVGQSMGTNAL